VTAKDLRDNGYKCCAPATTPTLATVTRTWTRMRGFDPAKGTIPVVFGKSSGNGPQIGEITKLRRNDDTLLGKLAKVDPRIESVARAGKLPGRRSFSVQRSDDGLALARVGIHPPSTYVGGGQRETPATDDTLTALANGAASHDGTVEFGDCSSDQLSWNGAQRSELLSTLAQMRQSEEHISFAEALTKVAAENPELTIPDWHRGLNTQRVANSAKLCDMAKRSQRAEEISFGEALALEARLHPELT